MEKNNRSIEELRALWEQLGSVGFDESSGGEMITAEPFLHFEPGTDREAIWHWFEAQNTEFSVVQMLYGTT